MTKGVVHPFRDMAHRSTNVLGLVSSAAAFPAVPGLDATPLGGGRTVLTGASFIDSSNVNQVAKYAAVGNRY